MAHGDVRERKWRWNWRKEWVASTLHATSEHGVSSITTADVRTSAVSSRLNWRPRRFKWTRPFRRKKKTGFCACAITFQTQSTTLYLTLQTRFRINRCRYNRVQLYLKIQYLLQRKTMFPLRRQTNKDVPDIIVVYCGNHCEHNWPYMAQF